MTSNTGADMELDNYEAKLRSAVLRVLDVSPLTLTKASGGLQLIGEHMDATEPLMPEPTPMISIQGKTFDSEQETETRLLRKENLELRERIKYLEKLTEI